MARALEAVEFWLNSPPHRRILLNRNATEVGVGYTVSFNAPNVWYWTAEFGNPTLPPPVVELPAPPPVPDPILELVGPTPNSYFATGLAPLTFSWRWSNALTAEQQFVVYLIGEDNRPLPIGSVFHAAAEQQYQLVVPGGNLTAGDYVWQVQLQNRAGGQALFTSDNWPLNLLRPGEEPPQSPSPTP
jgi:hypothetical protein